MGTFKSVSSSQQHLYLRTKPPGAPNTGAQPTPTQTPAAAAHTAPAAAPASPAATPASATPASSTATPTSAPPAPPTAAITATAQAEVNRALLGTSTAQKPLAALQSCGLAQPMSSTPASSSASSNMGRAEAASENPSVLRFSNNSASAAAAAAAPQPEADSLLDDLLQGNMNFLLGSQQPEEVAPPIAPTTLGNGASAARRGAVSAPAAPLPSAPSASSGPRPDIPKPSTVPPAPPVPTVKPVVPAPSQSQPENPLLNQGMSVLSAAQFNQMTSADLMAYYAPQATNSGAASSAASSAAAAAVGAQARDVMGEALNGVLEQIGQGTAAMVISEVLSNVPIVNTGVLIADLVQNSEALKEAMAFEDTAAIGPISASLATSGAQAVLNLTGVGHTGASAALSVAKVGTKIATQMTRTPPAKMFMDDLTAIARITAHHGNDPKALAAVAALKARLVKRMDLIDESPARLKEMGAALSQLRAKNPRAYNAMVAQAKQSFPLNLERLTAGAAIELIEKAIATYEKRNRVGGGILGSS